MKRTVLLLGFVLVVWLWHFSANAQNDAAAVKNSEDFTEFLGTSENAETVLGGMRSGTPFSLQISGDAAPIEFAPPPEGMGHGETVIALGLAREQLAQYGVTAPTAAQLQAVLEGGSITLADGSTQELNGIWAMRSEGAGWGEISQSLGVKLGPVVSSLHSGKAHPGIVSGDNSPVAADVSAVKGKGIVSGNGSEISARGHKGKTTTAGQGIVTGGNDVVSGSYSGHGKALGHGIVSGDGGAAVAHGGAKGMSQGKAKGQFK